MKASPHLRPHTAKEKIHIVPISQINIPAGYTEDTVTAVLLLLRNPHLAAAAVVGVAVHSLLLLHHHIDSTRVRAVHRSWVVAGTVRPGHTGLESSEGTVVGYSRLPGSTGCGAVVVVDDAGYIAPGPVAAERMAGSGAEADADADSDHTRSAVAGREGAGRIAGAAARIRLVAAGRRMKSSRRSIGRVGRVDHVIVLRSLAVGFARSEIETAGCSLAEVDALAGLHIAVVDAVDRAGCTSRSWGHTGLMSQKADMRWEVQCLCTVHWSCGWCSRSSVVAGASLAN